MEFKQLPLDGKLKSATSERQNVIDEDVTVHIFPGLICPDCKSSNFKEQHLETKYRKDGTCIKRQRYLCKNCNRSFVEESQPKSKLDIECPKCQRKNIAKAGKSRDTGEQTYRCKDCKIQFTGNPKRISRSYVSFDGLSLEEIFELDIWDVRLFGLGATISDGNYLLNFSRIYPDWLRKAVKYWLRYRIATDATSTLFNKLHALQYFSRFLQNSYPNVSALDISRKVITDYLTFIRREINNSSTRNAKLGCLRGFLESCARFAWADIYKEALIYPEDFSKQCKLLPRFIPDDVVKQIDSNLDALPEPVACMVKILRETGIRLSELCHLPFNCIRQDSTGTWWMDVYQFKMRKEIFPLTITKELATDIQRNQQYIKNNVGIIFPYLFCLTEGYSWFENYSYKRTCKTRKLVKKELNHFIPVPQRMRQRTLRGYLCQLAHEKGIKDVSGQIFPIHKCHQFRHTHGTELINAGVPQHIVQKRLGHVSPEMTMCYAHIHDETMKQEMEKFWSGRLVNIKGEKITSENPDLDTFDMQWLKKNMKAQALPTGWCRLPITQNCDKQGNPCFNCEFHVTEKQFLPVLNQQLENTSKLIGKAEANGWHRQIETNKSIAENLKKMIRSLEGDDNNG